jgi:hypothetical protein
VAGGGGAGYRFDPVDRGGVVLGLSAAQLAALGLGGAASALVGSAAGGLGGTAPALILLAAVAVLTCWPVHGRPPLAWVPVAGGWALRRTQPAALGPPPAAGLRGTRATAAAVALPPGVSIIEVSDDAGGPPVSAVRDRRAGTCVGVLAVRGRTLPLLDVEEQRRHLATWGALLAGLARPATPLHRVQWVARLRPGDRPGDVEQEVLVALAVRARGEGGASALGRELRLLRGQLTAADLHVGATLGADELRAAASGGVPGARWPRATDEAWSVWRADGEWHATWWIAEWPRVDVGPDFLSPLLLAGGCCRVALTMGPVPAARAARQVESARTASAADEELRRRAGFITTARRARRSEGMARLEAELADGHAEYRFSGYVTVSGDDRATLDARSAEVAQVAQGAGLDLRRLWGQQAEAFTWTLPLGRGLR